MHEREMVMQSEENPAVLVVCVDLLNTRCTF